jgi:hypothetical protein
MVGLARRRRSRIVDAGWLQRLVPGRRLEPGQYVDIGGLPLDESRVECRGGRSIGKSDYDVLFSMPFGGLDILSVEVVSKPAG